MTLIFVMSHKDASASSELSGSVFKPIVSLLNTLNISVNEPTLHTLIRKTAHTLVYLILGVFTFNAVSNHTVKRKRIIIITLLICLFYAISDEFHQTFIPGRSGEITDVLIDTLGSSLGILFMTFIKRNQVL